MTIEQLNNLILSELQLNGPGLNIDYPIDIELGKTNEMPSKVPCIWLFIEPKEVLASGLGVCKVTLFCCASAENSALSRISSLVLMERTARIIIDMQLALRAESLSTGFDAYYSDFACSYIEFDCFYELKQLLFDNYPPIDPAP